MANFETANRLAVLNGNEDPNWSEQTTHTNAPTSASSGINVQAAQVATVAISLRKEDVTKRTVYVQITFDAATTYTTNIDGNAVATVGNTSELQTLTDIRDDINADTPAGAGDVVTASLVDLDGDGTDDAVKLVGKAEADYTFVISVAAGAGTIVGVQCDPENAKARVWRFADAVTSTAKPPTWRTIPVDVAKLPAFNALDYRGVEETFNAGGASRFYVETYDLTASADTGTIAYTTRVDIGPGIIP